MTISWVQGSNELKYNDKVIACTCNVRNELNGLRLAHEVVKTMPGGYPYQPKIFPLGLWEVGYPIQRYSLELAPYFIPTNAYQMVNIWTTENGKYVAKTDTVDKDQAYGIHFSEYKNTLGCIKVMDILDLTELVHIIVDCYKRKEKVYLHVKE